MDLANHLYVQFFSAIYIYKIMFSFLKTFKKLKCQKLITDEIN